MKISRVEALTDGIIAIAATIMVLELHVPSINDWLGLLEIRNTVLSYVISFMLIYLTWSLHHDLFKKAENLSRKSFVINGIWILFLTFVPFGTAWVGTAPEETVPEFLYSANLMLWSLSFHWLEFSVHRDNPETEFARTAKRTSSLIMYAVFIVCIILAFIQPRCCIYLIGISTLGRLAWTIIRKRKYKS